MHIVTGLLSRLGRIMWWLYANPKENRVDIVRTGTISLGDGGYPIPTRNGAGKRGIRPVLGLAHNSFSLLCLQHRTPVEMGKIRAGVMPGACADRHNDKACRRCRPNDR